jgi:hypothetical protein
MNLDIEWTLRHAEEATLRLLEAERAVAKLQPQCDELSRDLGMAEATLKQVSQERAESEARHKIEIEALQRQLDFARRPLLKRLFA